MAVPLSWLKFDRLKWSNRCLRCRCELPEGSSAWGTRGADQLWTFACDACQAVMSGSGRDSSPETGPTKAAGVPEGLGSDVDGYEPREGGSSFLETLKESAPWRFACRP
ncbi:MAG: hypothetical protein ACLGPL_12315 [Acidobacteriota bacterium]